MREAFRAENIMSKAKAPPPKTSQEFENFQRLAKKLIAVPKKELDEKQAEYDKLKKPRISKKG